MFIRNFVVDIQTKNVKNILTCFVLQHIYFIPFFKPVVWERERERERERVMENTSVKYKMKNGKNRNLLNSETEKGKIWNGKSVPLHICYRKPTWFQWRFESGHVWFGAFFSFFFLIKILVSAPFIITFCMIYLFTWQKVQSVFLYGILHPRHTMFKIIFLFWRTFFSSVVLLKPLAYYRINIMVSIQMYIL